MLDTLRLLLNSQSGELFSLQRHLFVIVNDTFIGQIATKLRSYIFAASQVKIRSVLAS